MNRIYHTLKEMSGILSVSGGEEALSAYLEQTMAPFCDSTKTDAMGNLICKVGNDPKKETLLFVAHMDEIGFLICDVDENGFVLLAPVGFIHPEAAAFSRVRFESGRLGVIVPPSETKAADLDSKKLVCDIGAKSRAAALKLVKLGERCATVAPVTRLSSTRITSRALDNRLGVATLVATAEALKGKKLAYNLVFAFTVQEEVGLRGAAPVGFDVAPDYCINVDITPACDAYGAKGTVKLGMGPTIKYKDRSVVCNRSMIDFLTRCAKTAKVKTQVEILTYGGTDTGPIQSSRAGVVSGAISLPLRYVHTDAETADLDDAEGAVRLLVCAANSKFN